MKAQRLLLRGTAGSLGLAALALGVLGIYYLGWGARFLGNGIVRGDVGSAFALTGCLWIFVATILAIVCWTLLKGAGFALRKVHNDDEESNVS